MVDIFDEVEEDLRAERASRLLKRYGWLLIVLVLLIVGAVIGWQLWNRHQGQRDVAAAAAYVGIQNAIEQLDRTGGSKAGEITALEQLVNSAPEGYKTLARLRAAGLKAASGDVAGGVALWNAVAADPDADPLLRDLATLRATGRELDTGDPGKLRARLAPLAQAGNAWSALAREQLAMLDLRQGKVEEARKTLQTLSVDIDSPSGLRGRAAALLTGLASQGTQ